MATPQKTPTQRPQRPPGRSVSPTLTDSTTSRNSPDSVEKFNPFHDALGRFASKNGFKSYSANPKLKVAQPSILRSNQAGHGRVLNVHRESKGESIKQNANWLATGQKPAVPAAVSRQRYQQRKLRQQQQQQQQQAAAQKPAQKPAQQPPAPQKPTPPAKPSGVASGQAKNAVNGQDLAGKFRFKRNTTDYAIEQVIKAQGFDGKPTVTNDKAAFAKACQASNFIAKRGVGASNRQTLKAYDQELKDGEFYVKCSGGSVHGYGMYCASVSANGRQASSGLKSAENTANLYASGYKKIYTMTLDKSAKVGTENSLKRQMKNDNEFTRICRNSGTRADVGVYAAFKGFDAYIADNGRTDPNGGSSDYTVILNRSKVIILEP